VVSSFVVFWLALSPQCQAKQAFLFPQEEERPKAGEGLKPGESSLALGPDYFPLTIGNRWIYTRSESRLNKKDTVRIEIISTPIIKWKTYYVFNQLPFVPGLESANNILVRYDTPMQCFVKLTPEGDKPLFPAGAEADALFEPSVDSENRPVANRLSYLGCLHCENAGMEMVFDRGVGIVAIESTFPWGTENYELRSAEVNQRRFGELMVDPKAKSKKAPRGPIISRADPNFNLEVEKGLAGARLIMRVKNPTESFLSFNFSTSQTYDFVAREKESGFEVWRWSKGNFFSPVLRNLALLPEEEWKFEEVWDYRDNEHNNIRHATYEIVAILTTREPRESAPVEVAFP
jgi:hypothetical protein